MTVLECRSVVRELGEVRTRAVDDVSFSVDQGEFVALTGYSGSGKSTLLYLLSALDRPTSGETWFASRCTSSLVDDERALLRREHFGFVFQFHFLLPEFSVLENVVVPLRHRGVELADANARALDVLGALGIAELAARRPHQLSGGQQQRVSVARAIAGKPTIVFADEPTGNLDSTAAEATMSIFEELVRQGLTMVMVTHEPLFAQRAHREIHLRDGKIVSIR